MKNIFTNWKALIMCALLLAIAAMVLAACASGPSPIRVFGDFEYTVYKKWATIKGYRGTSTEVVIPSRIRGRPVVGITITSNNKAFMNKGITAVTFPDTLTSIGTNAFFGNALTEITIPGNVKKIDASAFANNRLTSITLPSSLTSIGTSAFANNQLTSVTLPAELEIIYSNAFAGNRLSSVVLPEKLESIGYNAFANNPLLRSISVPDTVKNLTILYESPNDDRYSFRAVKIEINGTGADRTISITELPDSGLPPTTTRNSTRIVIPSDYFGIPVTAITGTKRGKDMIPRIVYYIQHSGPGFQTVLRESPIRQLLINELVLPASLKRIGLNTFPFCVVERVTAPNEEVRAVWNSYYNQQLASDKQYLDALQRANQRAYNETVENLRQWSEELR